MRVPSTLREKWGWWEAAIEGQDLPIHEGEPQAGFYKVRKFPYGEWPRGPYVPARVWWEPPEIDELGELIADERCRAEIDGKEINPWNSWTWIARRPVPLEEWQWLVALSPLLPSKIPNRG